MEVKFKPVGYYIEGCGLPGETKADEVFPAQHNTVQLAKDRWFVIFETRGFRGNDDNRSVVYQLRQDRPDGPVLRERYLDRQVGDWDPLGDGRRFIKLCNHSVVFGLPEGAVVKGETPGHAGSFAATWRRNPRILDRTRDYLVSEREQPLPSAAYRCVWCQFRLNAARDDIELTQPVQPLLERGVGTAVTPSRHLELTTMNQSYVNPVPLSRQADEWAFLLHWSQGANEHTGVCTPIRFRWNRSTSLYEWIETGSILGGTDGMGIFEGGIAAFGDDWLVAARITPRCHQGTMWFRMNDLFGLAPSPVYSPAVRSHAPRTVYGAPDGILRIFTTDHDASPYRDQIGPDVRMPLQCFEIDPDRGFAVSASGVVYDGVEEGLPMRLVAGPTAHFCRLLPHLGGRHGLVTYSVRPKALKHSKPGALFQGQVLEAEMHASGVYASRITYREDYPPTWNFAS
jgi:hypothetical protein